MAGSNPTPIPLSLLLVQPRDDSLARWELRVRNSFPARNVVVVKRDHRLERARGWLGRARLFLHHFREAPVGRVFDPPRAPVQHVQHLPRMALFCLAELRLGGEHHDFLALLVEHPGGRVHQVVAADLNNCDEIAS